MVCSCGQSVYSLGMCNGCLQKAPLIVRYPLLSTVVTFEALERLKGGQTLSDDTPVDTICQKCQKKFSVQLISLLKQMRRNISKKTYCTYQCHSCSKEGKSKIGMEFISSVIDLPLTISKFGGLPINVKRVVQGFKGNVIARCEDCKEPFEVKASSILHSARRHKLNGRKCVYKCFDCGIKRQDAVEASSVAREKQLLNGFKSGLEIAMENRLKVLGLNYQSQFRTAMYVWDFFLPDYDLLIDVNGEYWHSLPKNTSKDRSKLTYVERYLPQYKTLVIQEKHFLNPLMVDQIVQEYIGKSFPISIQNFSFDDLAIRQMPSTKKSLSPHILFLDSYHYAKSGRYGKIIFGAYLGNELIAICKFNSVVRQEVASSMKLKCNQVLELDRFCIHPSYHKKNFGSWFISRCMKEIFTKESTIMGLASFADETFGHSGSIYKAANWTNVGKTRPSYHYMDKLGIPINKKRVFDIASKLLMKESDYAIKHELQKFREMPKTKFIFLRPTS